MERVLQITADGSHTISIPSLQVTYHSRHGAIQESMHVFIKAGWEQIEGSVTGPVNILEMGFGTGLNALLTLAAAGHRNVHYESTEAYPLDPETIETINYCGLLQREDLRDSFLLMHNSEWNERIPITDTFMLTKHHCKLEDLKTQGKFHLVYFDAFAPNAQPELWTEAVFKNLYDRMLPGGILVTYCSKGNVRRAMEAAGLQVEKIPGPPGKREMVRAWKRIG